MQVWTCRFVLVAGGVGAGRTHGGAAVRMSGVRDGEVGLEDGGVVLVAKKRKSIVRIASQSGCYFLRTHLPFESVKRDSCCSAVALLCRVSACAAGTAATCSFAALAASRSPLLQLRSGHHLSLHPPLPVPRSSRPHS